jgi:hypothetical protein
VAPSRHEGPVGGVSRVQVEIEQPPPRLVAVGRQLVGLCLIGGVGVQQVVQPVSVAGDLLQKVDTRQHVEQPAGLRRWDVGECRGCGKADLRSDFQTDQPEHPGCGGW